MGKRLRRARQFIRDVRDDEPDPLYFVYGEEGYLLDRAVETILESAVPEEERNDFNFDEYRGRSASGEDVLESVEMLPMMVQRRAVVVRDLQEMPTTELAELEKYFEDPSSKTCLVLHARTSDDAAPLDMNSGVVRTLKREATTCEFESLYDNEVSDVVDKHARSRGLSLTSSARAYLIQAVGTDIGTLDRALDKIDLYIGPADEDPRRVDETDVAEITAETRVRSVFDLTDALGDREYQEALEILDGMLLDGQSAIRILFMIARHFRLVDRLHDPELRGASTSEKSSELGVLSMFLDDYERHARTFSAREVDDIRTRLLDADRELKSSGLSDRIVLESLLYDICFRDAGGTPDRLSSST